MKRTALTPAGMIGCAIVMTAAFPLTLAAQTPRIQWTPTGDVPVSITVGGRAANPVTIAIAP